MTSAISSKQKSDLGESDNKWVLLNNRGVISTIIIFYVGPIVKMKPTYLSTLMQKTFEL